MPEYAIRSVHSLLCDVTLAAMGRSQINTGNSGVTPSVLYTTYFLPFAFTTLCIFYTPHFAHSSFSNLLIFYTLQILHSVLHVFHRTPLSPQFSPLKSLFPSQSNHRKQRKAFFQDLLEVFLEFTPNTILVKDFYFGPKARSSACTADGRGEMISNSNCTEWSTVQGVIARVISKSDKREARG